MPGGFGYPSCTRAYPCDRGSAASRTAWASASCHASPVLSRSESSRSTSSAVARRSSASAASPTTIACWIRRLIVCVMPLAFGAVIRPRENHLPGALVDTAPACRGPPARWCPSVSARFAPVDPVGADVHSGDGAAPVAVPPLAPVPVPEPGAAFEPPARTGERTPPTLGVRTAAPARRWGQRPAPEACARPPGSNRRAGLHLGGSGTAPTTTRSAASRRARRRHPAATSRAPHERP